MCPRSCGVAINHGIRTDCRRRFRSRLRRSCAPSSRWASEIPFQGTSFFNQITRVRPAARLWRARLDRRDTTCLPGGNPHPSMRIDRVFSSFLPGGQRYRESHCRAIQPSAEANHIKVWVGITRAKRATGKACASRKGPVLRKKPSARHLRANDCFAP
jgi:hypothetical protein